MKKIFILFVCFAPFMACNDLTDLNTDPKRSPVVPAGSLFASAEKELADNLTTANVNIGVFRLLAQQWTQTTYTDESNYDLGTRNIPQNWWHALYRDVLKDLQEAKKIVEADADLSEEVKTNQLAMIEIVEVYAWSMLIDTFGDIPYEEALKVSASPDDILQPVYDDAATIYGKLIARLDIALDNLDVDAESWGSSDLIYGGDVALWLKFGNSIKLKFGMKLADVNATLAEATVESAVSSGVLTSNDDNAIFLYKSAPPNTNPIWEDLVQSGRKDYVAANTLVNAMNAVDDPRRNFYFTTVDTLVYNAYQNGEPAPGAVVIDTLTVFYGGVYGSNNGYSVYSKPGDMVDNSDFPGVILDYAEVEFYLAEARERNFAVGGTAEEHYHAAITASAQYWGVSDAAIADYLALPEVAYSTATGTYSQKIGMQKWFASYNRGFEAWTEWRRLDFPVLVKPKDGESVVPLRYTYPVSEQNVNTAHYNEAVAKLGEDNVAKKVFWDVK
jgi:hypothetical protein